MSCDNKHPSKVPPPTTFFGKKQGTMGCYQHTYINTSTANNNTNHINDNYNIINSNNDNDDDNNDTNNNNNNNIIDNNN